jgi:hypothetical protein
MTFPTLLMNAEEKTIQSKQRQNLDEMAEM